MYAVWVQICVFILIFQWFVSIARFQTQKHLLMLITNAVEFPNIMRVRAN